MKVEPLYFEGRPNHERTEREVMAFNKANSSFWGWAKMGLRFVLGIMGSDAIMLIGFALILAEARRSSPLTAGAPPLMYSCCTCGFFSCRNTALTFSWLGSPTPVRCIAVAMNCFELLVDKGLDSVGRMWYCSIDVEVSHNSNQALCTNVCSSIQSKPSHHLPAVGVLLL